MRTSKSSCCLLLLLAFWAAAAEFADGPLRVTLTQSKSELIAADELFWTCTVVAPVDAKLSLPGPEQDWDKWKLADFAHAPPELLGDNQVRHVLRYTLEPVLPDDYTLPSLVIIAGDHRVETPATELTVIPTIDAPHKAELRALAEAPPEKSRLAQWILGLGVGMMALLGLVCMIPIVICIGVLYRIRKESTKLSDRDRALSAIDAATDSESLAAALRQWAPHLLPRLDA